MWCPPLPIRPRPAKPFQNFWTASPELYDLTDDPAQRKNRIAKNPEVAAELRAAYDRWWSEVEPFTKIRAASSLGHAAQESVTLCSAEWRENAMAGMDGLRRGVKKRGVWDVDVTRDGTYEIALRRWPAESALALRAPAPAWIPRDTATPEHAGFAEGAALPIATAHLRIGDANETKPVGETDEAAVFLVPLKAGRTELTAHFTDADGKLVCSAFFVNVRREQSANRR